MSKYFYKSRDEWEKENNVKHLTPDELFIPVNPYEVERREVIRFIQELKKDELKTKIR